MFTQCPQCRQVYNITIATLCESHGRVRCGRCGEVFQSLDALSDESPGDGLIEPPFFNERPPTLKDPDRDDKEQDLFLDAPTPTIDFEQAELDDPLPPTNRPEPIYRHSGQPVKRRTLWGTFSFLLILALAGQAGWTYRDTLVHHPQLRPWLDQACEKLDCTLPRKLALGQLRLVSRDIRPHPSVEDALIITATMQNQAEFVQDYPQIEIVLSDLSGNIVAHRRFGPDDYLDPGIDQSEGLAPATLLPLVFEVVDPGDDAVAFEFSFHETPP